MSEHQHIIKTQKLFSAFYGFSMTTNFIKVEDRAHIGNQGEKIAR